MLVAGMDANLAFGSIELDTGRCRDDLVNVKGLGFFGRKFPQIDRVISAFHRIADDTILAILCLDRLDKAFILRIFQALEITHAGVVANCVFFADAIDLVFGYDGRQQLLLRAVEARCFKLLVKRDVAATDDGRVDPVRLGSSDLADD